MVRIHPTSIARPRATNPARLVLIAVLAALPGCGSGVSWHATFGPSGGTAGIHVDSDAPAITTVRLTREGHDLAVRLALAADPGLPRPPLTGATGGRDGWTFQLAFDADRDRTTGDPTGAEYAAVVDARGAATLLSWRGSGWQRVAVAPIRAGGDAVEFRLDADRFGVALEHAAITAESYRVSALPGGGSLAIPAGSLRAAGDASPVPALTQVRSELRDDTLFVRGQFEVDGSGAIYDPATAGGWSLQMLLDTGEDGVGYWRGYDYIVRGGEWSGGWFTVRRITLDDSTPGGWGPVSGRARFRLLPRHFELAIPLGALGGDDGHTDFVLETYATVACPSCEGGVSAEYSADTFGSTDRATPRRDATLLANGLDAARIGIAPPPAFTAGAR